MNKLINTIGAFNNFVPLNCTIISGGDISKANVLAAQNLCRRLTEIFPEEKPSLLHGDLWTGNFAGVPGVENMDAFPAIFDPAIYYGHREMDIGMSLLFGGFHPRFYEAYQSFFPLESNWRKRVPLTQLYPLLVHATLFGGGYVNQCRKTLDAWK